MSNTALCDHCSTILVLKEKGGSSSDSVFWCAECLLDGGRSLLKSHNVVLSCDDDFYKLQGYTFWNKYGSYGKIIITVPKKLSDLQKIEQSIQEELPIATVEKSVQNEPCRYHYYGIDTCTCSIKIKNVKLIQ